MPTEDKLEEGKITLFAKLSSGKITDKKCEFHVSFKKGPDFTSEFQTETIAAEMVDRVAKKELDLPRVPDDVDNYKCTWHLMHENKRYEGETSWIVWPRQIEILTKDENGAKLVEGVPFTLEQKQQRKGTKKAESLKDGIATFNGLAAAIYTVEVFPAYEGVWAVTKGRKREVHVKKTPLRTELVSPKLGVHKQYVNCQSNGGDFYSSVLKVKVGPKGGVSLAGEKIFIKATFGRESNRNSPEPTLKDVENLVGPTSDGDKRIFLGEVTLDGTGAAVELKLQLGLAGGDTCKLEVSGASNARTAALFPADETLEITNWRKLYYQVTRPANLPQTNLARIKTALAEIFLDYEASPEKTLDPGCGPAGSWHPAADLGLAGGDCLIIGDHNKAYFHREFNEVKMPRSVHTLFCHDQLDGGGQGLPNDGFMQALVKNGAPVVIGGIAPFMGYATCGVQLGPGYVILPRSVHKDGPAVTGARWQSTVDKSRSGDIPQDHVFIDYAANRPFGGILLIRLPVTAVAELVHGDVLMTFWLSVVRGPYLGEADRNALHLQLINAAIASDTQNDIMAHELGHSLGMVAIDTHPIPGIADPATVHDWKYEGRGHQGPHCAYGAAKPLPADMNTQAAVCKCVMFGANNPIASASDGHFCVNCQPLLQAQDCVKIH